MGAPEHLARNLGVNIIFISGTDWTHKEMSRILLNGVLSVTVERAHRNEDEHIANFSREVLERAKEHPFYEEAINDDTVSTYKYELILVELN